MNNNFVTIVTGILLLTAISHRSMSQVWSPDGSEIAFFYIHSIEDIYLVNADGTDFRIVDRHPDRDFVPTWSPNGKYLLFTSIRDGHHEIYRTDRTGKKVKKLTETAFNSEDGDYSPSGSEIVFASDRGGNNDIFIMDRNGKNIKQITKTRTIETTARWSPDGSKILFRSALDKDARANLFLMNVDGTERKQLTDNSDPEFHQSWSPDGSKICYIKIIDGTFEVHVLDLKTLSDQTLVSKKGYQAFYPQWSPDGQWIAFTRDVMEGTQEGYPALLKVDLSGKEALITNENSFHLYEEKD